jgi:hypothetical protein
MKLSCASTKANLLMYQSENQDLDYLVELTPETLFVTGYTNTNAECMGVSLFAIHRNTNVASPHHVASLLGEFNSAEEASNMKDMLLCKMYTGHQTLIL